MKLDNEVLSRLNLHQKMYDDLTKEVEGLHVFEKKFKEISEKMRTLSTYYQEDWMRDVDSIKNTEKALDYTILGQDAIWNLLSDHYQFNKKMLKVLAIELNK